MAMMKDHPSWTRPYCGVTHRHGLPHRYRISASQVGSDLFDVRITDREGERPFTAVRSATGKTLEEALAIGDAWADEITPKPLPKASEMVDRIADILIGDHMSLMLENRLLTEERERLKSLLREAADELRSYRDLDLVRRIEHALAQEAPCHT
jgi:hypothetical protein